jgi:hypothetical protein
MPQAHHKYFICIVLSNADTKELVACLEPWCSNLYITNANLRKEYTELEQKRTDFDLSERVLEHNLNSIANNDIIVNVDAKNVTQADFQLITQLPEILAGAEEQENATGKFELGNLILTINKLDHYEHQLINLKTDYN